MTWDVLHGECVEVIAGMEPASVDAVVTDPPYELGFMGKKWDSTGIAYRVDLWAEVLRVLKPGGHLVAFGGSRTYHRMACAIEDAGFQIRDSLMWLQGTGFPKSLRLSRDPRFCQCVEPARSGGSTAPSLLPQDRNDMGAASGGDDLLPGGGRRLSGEPSGSPSGCPPGRDCGGERARSDAGDAPASPPPRGCAQAHTRSLALAGGPGDAPVRSPSQARRNARPSNPGSPLPSDPATSEPASTPGSRSRADTSESDLHIQGTSQGRAYGTGLPRCPDCGLPNADGIGTALKPAHEPIVLARKPLIGTVAANVLAHGTGGLNIDDCRLSTADALNGGAYAGAGGRSTLPGDERTGRSLGMLAPGATAGRDLVQPSGRWPANVLLDEAAAAMLDEQSGDLQSGIMDAGTMRSGGQAVALGHFSGQASVVGTYGDFGGASRFFYTAKPSRDERDAGLDDLASRTAGQATGRAEGSDGLRSPRAGSGRTSDGVKNHHPTVKPVAVMEWLIDLVTPLGGVVLDPFCGSGTTGMAAVRRARSFVGIEQSAEYVEIATRRIEHWSKGQLDLLGRIA